MKLASYYSGKQIRAGLACGEWIVDIEQGAASMLDKELPGGVRELLEGGPGTWNTLLKLNKEATWMAGEITRKKLRNPGWMRRIARTRLAQPVTNPEKVICIGQNYAAHVKEQQLKGGPKLEAPAAPIFFCKFAATLTGPNDPVLLPSPKVTTMVDYEVEMALVVRKEAYRVTQKDALDYLAGCMIINDISARDCQRADKQWSRAKSFNTFGPCGPWIVSLDELGNPNKLALESRVNGEVRQQDRTSTMIHRVEKLVSYLSQGLTLRPGDIIATGTPHGVGAFREPPVFLQAGDVVECEIEGIGVIRNEIRKSA